VADKGYHSNDVLVDLTGKGYRTYISEPERGRRRWQDKEEAQAATYANRRRIRGNRGKLLLRQRGELLERPPSRTTSRRAACGERTCEVTRTSSSAC
jgi:transposase